MFPEPHMGHSCERFDWRRKVNRSWQREASKALLFVLVIFFFFFNEKTKVQRDPLTCSRSYMLA